MDIVNSKESPLPTKVKKQLHTSTLLLPFFKTKRSCQFSSFISGAKEAKNNQQL